MEEKQKKELSYEELKKVASDLHMQNQKMSAYIQNMQNALNEQAFNQTSFFVSMLFKVLEHPEMHEQTFVDWAAKKVEEILKSFDEAISGEEEEKANEAE